MTIHKITAAGLVGFALAASSSAALAAPPEGLYSADQLLDADVYAEGSDKQIGEIDDIVFDNNMTIKSFIVETEGKFGLGGKSYVVEPNQLSVETIAGPKAIEPNYRVTLNASSSELSGYPVYNDAWWEGAQSQASDAWEQTRESASSAWTRLKEGTNDLIDRAQGQNDNQSDNEASGATTDQSSDAGASTGTVIDNSADDSMSNADDTNR
ncbi:PRC-barrel domain-containing protein [Salinisphaera aquimarina]|uniref:PRC-barrel domain-containing protein n=1 Tax=Salinisphaera aquimarina TaxID=2094031 RepID=A0ABV7ENB6_9GAMM